MRALSGLPWTAHSPSRYTLALPTENSQLQLTFDGLAWYLAIGTDPPDTARPWPSRDFAAAAIAAAFLDHQLQEQGLI